MDSERWWRIVHDARAAVGERAGDRDSADDPLVEAVVERLVRLPAEEIVAFDVRYVETADSAYTRPLWNAAYLIEGGCGDDGFMDFRAGLMLQGREAFERAVADPDSLADLPVVRRMGTEGQGWLGCEGFSYAARDAYRRARGEADAFDAAMEAALAAMARPSRPSGEDWDVEDEAETLRRLPRLAELFSGAGP
ncbi:DUF4240 domain-containing protein [Spirillospora sp. NPDC050679]